MAKTSGEYEKEFIDGLKPTTGKGLEEWLALIKKGSHQKRNDIIPWLKEEKGFNHSSASMLTAIYLNNGKPVYASEDNLLSAQLAGKEQMQELYDALISFVSRNFPGCIVLPKKTYVSINFKREFAAINIRKDELRLGLDLGEEAFTDVLRKSKLTGPMPRISHMLVINTEKQLNGYLVEMLSRSNNRVNN